jgi:hypothetical protein
VPFERRPRNPRQLSRKLLHFPILLKTHSINRPQFLRHRLFRPHKHRQQLFQPPQILPFLLQLLHLICQSLARPFQILYRHSRHPSFEFPNPNRRFRFKTPDLLHAITDLWISENFLANCSDRRLNSLQLMQQFLVSIDTGLNVAFKPSKFFVKFSKIVTDFGVELDHSFHFCDEILIVFLEATVGGLKGENLIGEGGDLRWSGTAVRGRRTRTLGRSRRGRGHER